MFTAELCVVDSVLKIIKNMSPQKLTQVLLKPFSVYKFLCRAEINKFTFPKLDKVHVNTDLWDPYPCGHKGT